ncbi:MAG TPA: NAD-dependent epimerase/dehydratase family protein, partial [Planctomycetota bacterium]|nr:NAD-dependent epimerase/dehydratase family protein [Planctomycetota bacterium]
MSPSSPERVLVTGATGLLGQRLVPLLVAAGHAVRVLVRGDAAAPAGVEVVRGDLRDAAAVQQAVRGCAAVYHLGAVTAKWLPDAREFEAVNVGATLQLARMAADAGAQRIVHVSSFTVFGPSAPGTVLDESAAIRPELLHNDYQRSKARAHLQLQQQAQRDGLPVVIACPGVLFDAGDAGHRNPVAELMCA